MLTETYNLYSLIATATGFTITIVGLILVYRQIVTAIKDRETDTLIRLYEISTREPLYSDFNRVWSLSREIPMSAQDEEASLRACLFFEMVGAISSQAYIDTVLIEEYFGSLVTGCYDSMLPFILSERQKPYNDKFAINFQRLATTLASSSRISQSRGRAWKYTINSSRWTGRL
jgi:hypothetical protein